MAGPRKYMFDLDFDPPTHAPRPQAVEEQPVVEPEEEIPPPPTFSEEELQLARDSAYGEGVEAGIAQMRDSIDHAVAAALGALAAGLDGLRQQQDDANETNARNAVRAAMAALKKMLPAACERHAFDEVARVVETVVGHVLDEPRIIVRTAAGMVDAVRERLETVAQSHGFEGRVLVQPDPRLPPGDCRIEWNDGGAERDQVRLWADIEVALDRALESVGNETVADA